MTFEELVILLPCHSLEDFPVHHHGRVKAPIQAVEHILNRLDRDPLVAFLGQGGAVRSKDDRF